MSDHRPSAPRRRPDLRVWPPRQQWHAEGGDRRMSGISPELFQRWYRSFEEDTEDLAVYRPADYPFPPSRAPRPSIEFGPGGAFVEYGSGPADQAVPSEGSWTAAEGDAVGVQTGTGERTLHIGEIG